MELRAVCRSSGVIALPAVTTGVQRGLCGRRSVPEPSLPLANIAVYLRLLALSSGPDRRVHIPQQPGDKARLLRGVGGSSAGTQMDQSSSVQTYRMDR